jgi:hypothetical protein
VVALLLQSTQYLLYGIANFSCKKVFNAADCSMLLDLKYSTYGTGSAGFGSAAAYSG